jgi:Secretion system C-terminal sorting domain
VDQLPADYDVFLINSSGTQVGASENGNTTAEIITLNNAPAGTYRVKIVGYNGAFSSATAYRLWVNTSAAAFRLADDNTDAIAPSITFYPNPTTGKLFLSLPAEALESDVNVLVRDLTGRVLFTTVLPAAANNTEAMVDMQELNTGLYLVTVQSGAVTTTQKVQVLR